MSLLPRWLRVRLRARRIYLISRARLTAEFLADPFMPDEDAEQLARLGAVMWLDKRRERVLKVKVRRELRKSIDSLKADIERLERLTRLRGV